MRQNDLHVQMRMYNNQMSHVEKTEGEISRLLFNEDKEEPGIWPSVERGFISSGGLINSVQGL